MALSMLQKAANQAMQEDKEAGKEAMFFAADQIANEKGLTSPLRRRSPNQLERSLELSQSLDRYSLHEKGAMNMNNLESSFRPIEESEQKSKNEADALAFLKSMNVEPVQVPVKASTVGFESDVMALMKMSEEPEHASTGGKGKKKGKTLSATDPKPFQSKSGYGKDRYLNRLAQSRSLGGGKSSMSSSRRNGSTVVSEQSKISKLLARAEEKSYHDRIRASFQSEMQEMLFRSMHVIQPLSARSSGTRSSFSSSRYAENKHGRSDDENEDNDLLHHSGRWKTMREMSDRLSKPMSHQPTRLDMKIDPTLKYYTLDDAKECTFQPNYHKKRHQKDKDAKRGHHNDSDEDEGKKEDPKYSFISRQEAEERVRREELAYKIGKKDYDASVYKKQCPKCLAKQSYDEIKEKRKLCPNCRVEYQYLMTWGKVSKHFFQKCREYSIKSIENKKKIIFELENEYKFKIIRKLDPHTNRLVNVQEEIQFHEKLTPQQEKEFYKRLKEYQQHHKEMLEYLEKEITKEYYPFQPQIAQLLKKSSGNEDEEDEIEADRKHHYGDDDNDGEDDDDNAIKAFLHRYERDLQERREKMPMRYKPIRKYRPIKKRHGGGPEQDDDDDDEDDYSSDEEYDDEHAEVDSQGNIIHSKRNKNKGNSPQRLRNFRF